MQYNKSKSLQFLGKAIKSLRNKRKWKKQTLAFYVGLSPSTISRIERGECEPRYNTLKNIASGFDLKLAEFISYVEDIEKNLIK